MDYSRYPNEAVQKKWITYYLEESARIRGAETKYFGLWPKCSLALTVLCCVVLCCVVLCCVVLCCGNIRDVSALNLPVGYLCVVL